jgi:hypothetical protein
VWWQELIDGYASNAATISTNRRAVSSPRSIPIAVLPRRSRSGRPSGRLSETGYRGSRGQGDQRRTVEAGVVEASEVKPMTYVTKPQADRCGLSSAACLKVSIPAEDVPPIERIAGKDQL